MLNFDNMLMETTTGLPARAFKQLGAEEIGKIKIPLQKVKKSIWNSVTKSWDRI